MNTSTPIHQLFPYISETCSANHLPKHVYIDLFRHGILTQVSGKTAIRDFVSRLDTYLSNLHTDYSEKQVATFYNIIHTLFENHPDISVPFIERYENMEEEQLGERELEEQDLWKPKCDAMVWLAGFITARVFQK